MAPAPLYCCACIKLSSRIDYASFIWNNLPKYLMAKLDRIQFEAIRIALGYQRSTPTNILLAEAKEPALELRFCYLGCNYISKVLPFSNHPLIPKLESLSNYYKSPIYASSLPKTIVQLLSVSKFSHL